MIFPYSAVSSIDHDCITESSATVPVDIHAALLGSGEIALGLDATGLQGLDCRINRTLDTWSLVHASKATDVNLHIYRDEALSNHYAQQGNDGLVVLPCGWLDYVLEIDGERFDARTLAARARQWKRTFRPKQGLLVTSFTINDVRMTLTSGLAIHAVEFDTQVDFESLDGEPHRVSLTWRAHQTLRDGRPLATGGLETDCDDRRAARIWRASTATSSAAVYKPITVNWAIACQDAAVYGSDATHIHATWSGCARCMTTGFRVISGSDRDGTETPEYIDARVRSLRDDGLAAGLGRVRHSWESFFSSGAEVWLGDPQKEFLALQAQYVTRAGGGFHAGYPLGTLWSMVFGGATFWDTFFLSDGFMRAGHFEEVRQFCAWIVENMPVKGRPFFWMTYYDGVPAGQDNAYQVNLAYAQIAIRLYEHTRDMDDLKLRVFPYLHRLAEYAFKDLLVKDERGWHLRGEIAGDVDAENVDAGKETGMFYWVAACLDKVAEYAEVLGVDDEVIGRCRQLGADLRDDPVDLSEPGMWGMWYTYLAGVSPMMDQESWERFVAGRYADTHHPGYVGQPWFTMSESAGLTLSGHPDQALTTQDMALEMTGGIGYFYESPPETRSGGFAPYPPATGSYLSSLLSFFAEGGLWDNEVRIGNLPKRWRYHRLRFSNVATLNGAVVSGRYTPTTFDVSVRANRPLKLLVAVPGRLVGEPIAVEVNSRAVEAAEEAGRVAISVEPGTTSISIACDAQTRHDAVVIEPLDQGREIAELIRNAGMTVRWVRNLDEVPDLAESPKLIFVHASYITLPVPASAWINAAVQNGARLVTLWRAGLKHFDSALAELTGLNATYVGNWWEFYSEPMTYTLTDAGKGALPGVPETLDIPQVGRFESEPAADVEILAVDAATDQPTVTRRSVGKGDVVWIAAGNANADGPQLFKRASMKDVYFEGKDAQHGGELKWLHSEGFRRLFTALLPRC